LSRQNQKLTLDPGSTKYSVGNKALRQKTPIIEPWPAEPERDWPRVFWTDARRHGGPKIRREKTSAFAERNRGEKGLLGPRPPDFKLVP
jgi:hypothetical protein